jgi:hypothetical protein
MGERSAKTSTTTPSSGDRVARGPRPVLMTTVAPASASALSSPPFLLRPRSGARHAAPLLKPGPSPPSAPPPPLRQAFSGTHATTTAMPDQHLPNNRPRVSTQGRAPQRPARPLTVPRERLRSRALQLHSNSQSAAGPECCGPRVLRAQSAAGSVFHVTDPQTTGSVCPSRRTAPGTFVVMANCWAARWAPLRARQPAPPRRRALGRRGSRASPNTGVRPSRGGRRRHGPRPSARAATPSSRARAPRKLLGPGTGVAGRKTGGGWPGTEAGELGGLPGD